MRHRSQLVIGFLLLAMSMTGCATVSAGGGIAIPIVTNGPTLTPTADGEAAAAQDQAQAWLKEAVLPPAVRSDGSIGGFTSHAGWPCGPVEELESSPGSQQDVVDTVAATSEGVAARAEIAALAESAVCPTRPVDAQV